MTPEIVVICDWCGEVLEPDEPAICERCLVAFRIEVALGLADHELEPVP